MLGLKAAEYFSTAMILVAVSFCGTLGIEFMTNPERMEILDFALNGPAAYSTVRAGTGG
jgi:hypothetical protein